MSIVIKNQKGEGTMKVKLKIKIKSKFFTYETNSIVNHVESKFEHKSFASFLEKNPSLKPAFSN